MAGVILELKLLVRYSLTKGAVPPNKTTDMLTPSPTDETRKEQSLWLTISGRCTEYNIPKNSPIPKILRIKYIVLTLYSIA